MATPNKKRNPQDATLRNTRALRKDLNEAIGALQALEIRVQAIETTMRGEAPYVDPRHPPVPPVTNGE